MFSTLKKNKEYFVYYKHRIFWIESHLHKWEKSLFKIFLLSRYKSGIIRHFFLQNITFGVSILEVATQRNIKLRI